jgi:hypothetical protein
LQTDVEALRALDRLRGEVGARCVADQQRIARDDEPRLVAAGAIHDCKTRMLGPVPGRVEDADHDVAEGNLLPVGKRLEWVLGLGGGVDVNRQTVLERESPVPGYVVGVRVRLEHARDPNPPLLGLRQIRLD